MKMRWQPAVRTAPSYHDHPVYIDALARSMRKHLAKLDFEPEKIIATFHGMPQKYFMTGDPYHCQCQKTSRLLREKLAISQERWLTTFQSRFGNDPWLQPYTDKTVESLARGGTKSVALVAPGFSADCLETLEELDRENRHIFESNGGEKFAYLPALNDSPEGIDVIEAIAARRADGLGLKSRKSSRRFPHLYLRRFRIAVSPFMSPYSAKLPFLYEFFVSAT